MDIQSTDRSVASQRRKEGAVEVNHIESVDDFHNVVYDDAEDEPELHIRTWIAVAALWVINCVQFIALQGPPSLLTHIAADLVGGSVSQTWIVNALVLPQAVLAPILSSLSDTFQIRKSLVIISCLSGIVGAAIVPGSVGINRVIVGSAFTGGAIAHAPLTWAIGSEILPRRYRAYVQAANTLATCLGGLVGPLIMGAFVQHDPQRGWRKFFWVVLAIWAVTAIGVFVGYRPPKRRTRFDHLSVWQKIASLDITGSSLLLAALTLMLVGINLGGGLYSWQNAHTLGPLVVGIVMVFVFAWYQWKGTTSGILHHDLFVEGRGRYFSIYLALIFIEGLMGFSYFTFYPIMEAVLFVTEPIRLVASQLPFWVAGGLFSFLWGALSTRFKTIREPLIAGFLIWTAGLVGLATIQPGDYISSMAFSGLTGLGFGSPLFLAVVGVQFVIPHHLLATSTALLFSTRAIGATIAVAIYSAALRDRLSVYLPRDVSKAVLSAGLPTTSVSAFIEHLFVSDIPGLADIAGVTPAVLAAGIAAFKQAYADALRVVFIISAPFGVVAVILSFFVADIGHEMTYRVDAPVEELHSKAHGAHKSEM